MRTQANQDNKMRKDKTPDKEPSKLRRFLYGLSWSVIFPIIIAVPAFIIMLMILGQILTSNINNQDFSKTISNDGIFYLELYLFAFVTLLVMVLFLVKWLLRTRKRLFFRTGAKVLGVYIWLGIFATGLTMAIITRNPDVIKPPTEQNAHLMQTLVAVGGDSQKMKDVSVKYVDGYKSNNGFTNQAGEYAPFIDSKGNFSYGILTVKQGLDVEAEKTVVAHEYLHHVWESQLDETTQHDLTSQLMTLYGRDDWLKTRTATYSDTNMLLPTELFAFSCTESPDQYLTQYVLDKCNTYIKRDTLRFIR